MKLVDWLRERRENALEIAAGKVGADQRGWLVDSAYFGQAVQCASQQERCGGVQANAPLRMAIALRLLRAWDGGTAGYDSEVLRIVRDWIDGGMQGPIPWPRNPAFGEWAAEAGFANVRGNVGFRLEAELLAPGGDVVVAKDKAGL